MHHLLRYFCEAGKEGQLYRNHDGLIHPVEDPDVFLSFCKIPTEIPQKWEAYSSYRSIVLLGPPRQGKTLEFEFQCGCSENGFLLLLRDISDPNYPEDAISDVDGWHKWLGSGEHGELFIDALDEGKIEVKSIINCLVNWIKHQGNDFLQRLRIHISCRSADWERIDQDRWLKLFQAAPTQPENGTDGSEKHDCDQDKGCIVLELLDLTRAEIVEFCELKQVDPKNFLSNVPQELISLMARPQTLGFLLEDYLQSRDTFPTKVQDLYERIIERRLQERNESHIRGEIPKAAPQTRRLIVEHYALTSVLTGQEVIAPHGADSVQEIPGGLSGRDLKEELEAFRTDTFQPYVHSKFRFNEPELADYLAAKKLDQLLSEQIIQARRIIPLFFPTSETVYPVPRLQRTLVWLCALNTDFRSIVIERNPGLLIHDYVRELTDDDKGTIWHWIVQNYGDRESFNISPTFAIRGAKEGIWG